MPLYPPKIDLLKIAWKILRAFKLIKKKKKKEKKKRKALRTWGKDSEYERLKKTNLTIADLAGICLRRCMNGDKGHGHGIQALNQSHSEPFFFKKIANFF
jgi:hypothetical protein